MFELILDMAHHPISPTKWCTRIVTTNFCFTYRLLLAATNTMTAMTTVPQIAALAAIVILSILLAGDVTVRTSLH